VGKGDRKNTKEKNGFLNSLVYFDGLKKFKNYA